MPEEVKKGKPEKEKEEPKQALKELTREELEALRQKLQKKFH